jgi:thiamine-phosphate pyrophosphorylase
MKLIVITSPDIIDQEAEKINRLFDAGLEIVHLRKPAAGKQELIKLLDDIKSQYHAQIVIHQHYELLNSYKLKGIHLTGKSRNAKDYPTEATIISSSFHNLEEMLKAGQPYEYVFFSPVFPSISKLDYAPSYSKQEMKDFLDIYKDSLPFSVIALGGITAENIQEVHALGFDGAACLGYIWAGRDPLLQYKNLKRRSFF